LRFVRGTQAPRDAALAGLFLGLASLASWYHLLYAAVLTPPLAAWALIAHPKCCWSARSVRGACVAVVVFSVVAGPLLAAILIAGAREPIAGTHDPVKFSADLYAFVFPNAAQRWHDTFGAHFTRWTGNTTENAAYVGLVVLALALTGAVDSGIARACVAAALCGAVLALGPQLHVDGRILRTPLPYAWLARAVPAIDLMGVPERLAYVMYFGLIVAAAIGLRRIADAVGRRTPQLRTLAIAVPFCIAACEYWPRPPLTTANPSPTPMRAWVADHDDWAVVDVWDSYRPMWHATIHRKPMVGGYLSRVPRRLDDWMFAQRILRAIILADQDLVVTRVDPVVDFTWPSGCPEVRCTAPAFDGEWHGFLDAPVDGSYQLMISANDAARLVLDDRTLLQCSSYDDTGCRTIGVTTLARGRHLLTLHVTNRRGAAALRLYWLPPDGHLEIVPATALRTPYGQAGLEGTYRTHVDPLSGLGRDEGRAALRALHVRYVVTRDGTRNACVEDELALPLVYRGEEVKIFEVPTASD